MRTRVALARCLGSASVCLLLAGMPALAHHPVQAKFDAARPLTLTGTVTAVSWLNPHVHIFMNVEGAGAAVNWAVELQSPIELEWSGWSAASLEAGDIITVTGPAARNDSFQVWGNTVQTAGNAEPLFTLADDVLTARIANRPTGPTPRWPDNQPRLGPPPGAAGYWAVPSAASLVEQGVTVEMDAHGLLRNIDDAASVAPFQTWARDLYTLRQRNFLKDDPAFLYCIPPGGPRQFHIPYGIQLVEERERERIFVLMGGGNGNWRLIYTDGREQVGQQAGDDDNPLFYGRAVATWQGDTLVISTKGFNESFWFSNGGLPHTALLELEERFTRPDLNTLHYEVTITDPGAYTRPWTSSWNLQWVPDQEMPEYYCQDNRP